MASYEGKAQMLIRKPAAEVFEAIVDPRITSRFWFTKGSGRLESGKRVQWQWEMYGVSADVHVLEIEPNRRVLVEWGAPGQPTTTVEWQLAPKKAGTFVTVIQRGFKGGDDQLVAQAIDSTSGFSLHLAGMKALLEHGIELGLTGDHHPRE
jgi:uncharacterized protein YndB with AHSA1/START domain